MSSDNPSFNEENDELLKIQQTQDSDEGKKEKRGTKSDLIDKIHKICDENGFICEYSPTQLKRLKDLNHSLPELGFFFWKKNPQISDCYNFAQNYFLIENLGI